VKVNCNTLEEYLETYGKILGQNAAAATKPLHDDARDAPLELPGLLRKPFVPQAHCITAGVKALNRQRTILLNGTMGTGKSLMGQLIAHGHAKGRPYRGLVLCPGHLVKKWERELKETIPHVVVRIVEHVRDLTVLDRKLKPVKPAWFVVSKDRAKLEPKWRAAFLMRPRDEIPRCPKCGKELMKKKQGDDDTPLMPRDLEKRRTECPCNRVRPDEKETEFACKEPLWTFTKQPWRFAPATYIKRRMKRYFKYLILDEVHELKGAADVAQANAAGSMAAACDKIIALTGTLTGGKAEDIRPLLFRLCPSSLIREGYSWSEATAFAERYGLIETRITTRESDSDDNRMSKGRKSSNTTRIVRPGIMPALFGRHLIDKTIFIGLEEMVANLPSFDEKICPSHLEGAMATEYIRIENNLRDEIKRLIQCCGPGGAMKLLGPMLNCLMAWPDYPFDWSCVGWTDKEGAFRPVVSPANFDPDIVLPKERDLIDAVQAERMQGRQVWVFVEYTDRLPVIKRLAEKCERDGLRVETLFSTVAQNKREEWIVKHAKGADVVLSHPGLVKTGLDLFDKGGNHNFPTLIFYETGWSAFTMRQASRRAWRIGQTEPCKVLYQYYGGTAEERCLELMGRKIAAAEALEGKFSSEGMAAMAGEDSSVQMALARNLAENIGTANASRQWQKVGGASEGQVALNWFEDIEVDEGLLALIGG
jgi:superfamily II DNA or RNA helicase